ncbi:MAG: methyltransferase domain-containing protein [Rhodospirillales bacterium]|nr:MAG: methyltransferase domain-containing protein [Rhodospirillales bacterium]
MSSIRPSPRRLDVAAVIAAYRRYAGMYDWVFGPAFRWGRRRSVARINALGCRRVLEVGVGTGLSLPRYRRDIRIVGIDVSRDMLAVAKRRVEEERLTHVDLLAEMDGEQLAFADHAFDAVVAMHVMSVVPDPQRCLAEMQRVCRPGGTILVCNHFAAGSEKWLTRRMEPFAKWLGWRPDFTLTDMLAGSSLGVAANDPVPPFGLFNLVILRND